MKQEYDYMIVRTPETTLFDKLTEEQQETIRQKLDARWMPSIMPGTVPVNGKKLIAAVVPRDTLKNFAYPEQLQAMLSDPAAMKAGMEAMAQSFGLDWELMYFRTVDGYPTGEVDPEGNPVMAPVEFYPMDAAVKDYIAPETDENGNSVPPTFPKKLAIFAMPGLFQYPPEVV